MRPISTRASSSNAAASGRLSRADIETLCILNAVGEGTCTPRQLAERLGLSVDLASVLVDVLQELAAGGLLVQQVGEVGGPYSVSSEGAAWMAERLDSAELE
jgi:hypothetical protein